MASTLTAKQVKALLNSRLPAQNKSSHPKSRSARRRRRAASNLSNPGVQISYQQPSKLVSRRRSYNTLSSLGKTMHGDQVSLLVGCQPYAVVSNTAGSINLIGGSLTGLVSPDAVGGTMAAISNRFSKYFFRKLCFEYVPYQPNSTDGHGFAFGFSPEGYDDLAATGYQDISTLQFSMFLPMTGFLGGPEMNTLEIKPSRSTNPWYWNENDTASAAGRRQTIQGLMYGVADSAITNATTWGSLWLHYELELCDLTPDQGFTLRRIEHAISKMSLEELHEVWKKTHPKDEEEFEELRAEGSVSGRGKPRRFL